MSLTEILAIVALTIYAIYRQTRVDEIVGRTRFKMAIIYGIVGVCVGGFDFPSGAAGYAMIAAGLGLSIVVGLARGRLTPVWVAPDGRILRQGTALTVSLFVGLIVAKFALGAWASIAGIDDGQGFGEVLVMIALMIAVQAELVWRRAQALTAAPGAEAGSAPVAAS